MLQLIVKKKDDISEIKISILSKLLSSICRFDFKSNILTKLFNSANESTSFIDNNFDNYKHRFLNSINLLFINHSLGSYLLKYYYIIFATFYTYHKSIKFLCIKIFDKSKVTKNQRLLSMLSQMSSNYKDINDLNLFSNKIDKQFKFSTNDDNNYNLINSIAKLYCNNLKKNHIINLENYHVFLDDTNIILSFLKNIYHLKKSIKYLK